MHQINLVLFRVMERFFTVIWSTMKENGLPISVLAGGVCIMQMARFMKVNGTMTDVGEQECYGSVSLLI